MNARTIAPGGLQSGGELHIIDVARFDFGLHQKMKDTVYFFCDNSQYPDFRLVDDRLLPVCLDAVVRRDVDSMNGEKFPGNVADIAGFRMKIPVTQPTKRDFLDFGRDAISLLIEPMKECTLRRLMILRIANQRRKKIGLIEKTDLPAAVETPHMIICWIHAVQPFTASSDSAANPLSALRFSRFRNKSRNTLW